MSDRTPKPGGQVGLAERRTDPRYSFAAVVEITDEKSGIRTNSNISDISQKGCFVETDSPLSLGTETTLRISKGTEAFEARARVVHSGTNGMGLLFTAVVQEQLRVLERWLIPFRQKEWLALHRHRSQRVLLQIPVRVSGRNALGSPFEEESQTVLINANGALLLLSTQMSQGQTLTLLNIAAQQSAECVVAYIGQHQGQRAEVGVGFLLPNPGFWHVNFPPRDWIRPVV
jgi:PilZ domain-containing protein